MAQGDRTNNWLEIGKIVAPQGLKGAVRVLPSTDFPERFESPGQRWLRRAEHLPPEPVQLLRGYPVPGKTLYVVQLAGIDNRDRAEALRGFTLLVPGSDRLPLQAEEYHVADLVGLAVYHQQTGVKVGTVCDVYITGNDILEIQLESAFIRSESSLRQTSEGFPSSSEKSISTKTALIPLVKAIIPVIDLDQGRIEILPPPGLLEANQ